MEPKCVHCGLRRGQPRRRGLCERCYGDKDVRRLYRRADGRYDQCEPTEAELERMIAEQMANLPAWWPKDGQKDTDE